jgi:hypothetical protein
MWKMEKLLLKLKTPLTFKKRYFALVEYLVAISLIVCVCTFVGESVWVRYQKSVFFNELKVLEKLFSNISEAQYKFECDAKICFLESSKGVAVTVDLLVPYSFSKDSYMGVLKRKIAKPFFMKYVQGFDFSSQNLPVELQLKSKGIGSSQGAITIVSKFCNEEVFQMKISDSSKKYIFLRRGFLGA